MRDLLHEVERVAVEKNSYVIFSVSEATLATGIIDVLREKYGLVRLEGVYKGERESSYIMNYVAYQNALYLQSNFVHDQESVCLLLPVKDGERNRRARILYIDAYGYPKQHPENWDGEWQWITNKMAQTMDHTYDPRTGSCYTIVKDKQ